MVRSKRGFCTAVVLVLLLVFSVTAQEEGETLGDGESNLKKYTALYLGLGEDDEDPCAKHFNHGLTHSNTCGAPDAGRDLRYGSCNRASCDSGSWRDELGRRGCAINGWEDDGWRDGKGDDTCGWVEISPGYVIHPSSQRLWGSVVSRTRGDKQDDDVECRFRKDNFYTTPEISFICGEDRFWYECNAGVKDQTIWVGQTLYVCTENEDDSFEWREKPGLDEDHDGYTTLDGDAYMDRPDDDSTFCPFIDPNELKGLKIEDIRNAARLKCAEDPIHYAKCNICRNKDAPEMCGDGVDNDGKPETSDDCNKNQFACEKGPRETSEPVDTTQLPNINLNMNNMYDQPFSWMDSLDGNDLCCGYGGIDDLGKEINSPSGKYICLSKNLVRSGTEISPTQNLPGWESDRCEGSWCWVQASSAAKFQIMTVHDIGGTTGKIYDVVSDGQSWNKCEEGKSSLLVEGTLPFVDTESANRFYCYKEGNHWSWAECVDTHAEEKNKGSLAKTRYAGDGLYSLPLPNEDIDPNTDERSTSGARIVITPSIKSEDGQDVPGDYADYYFLRQELDSSYFDFSGFDQLEFFVKLQTTDGDDVSQKLRLPADVHIRIFGPEKLDGTSTVFLDQPALGSSQSDLVSQNGEWLHVVVPLPDNIGPVSAIELVPTNTAYHLVVKHVYLSSSTEPTLFCSGKSDAGSGSSSWIPSFDTISTTTGISGEELCRAHYGGNAWLGEEVDDASAYCCGNSVNEYYAGPSEEQGGDRYGCWNSVPVKEEDTTMDVEFEVLSQVEEGDFSENLYEIEFNYQFIPTYPGFETLVDYLPEQEEKYGGLVSYTGEYFPLGSPFKVDFGMQQESDNAWAKIDLAGDYRVEDPTFHPSGQVNFRFEPPLSSSPLPIFYSYKNIRTLQNKVHSLQTNFVPSREGERYTFHKNQQSGAKVYVTWIFAAESFEKEIDLKHDDALAVFLAAGCTREEKFIYYFDPSADDCYFNYFNEYFSGDRTDSVTLEFQQGWNLLLFEVDNRGGGTFELSLTYPNGELPLEEDPQVVFMSSKGAFPVYPESIEIKVVENSEKVDATFYDVSSGITQSKINRRTSPTELVPLAKVIFPNEQGISEEEGEFTINKPCSQTECTYALPGKPSYKITNKRLDLYELYFVNESGEVLITNDLEQEFSRPGNVVARKVAQQVIYSGEKFFGCQAPSYLVEGSKGTLEPVSYCVEKSGKFCSPSSGSTINSWSDESLSEIGYDAERSTFTVEDAELIPLAEETTPDKRTQFASVIPLRNVISNAEFELDRQELPQWELFDGNVVVPNEKRHVEDKTVTLSASMLLRSERIVVPSQTEFTFGHEGTARGTVFLIDKEGNKEPSSSSSRFSTGSAVAVEIQFKGAGTVKFPLLQRVDEREPTVFSYDSTKPVRSAAACCSAGSCWNGYLCVNDMGPYTQQFESPDGEHSFRCIAGDWVDLPLKYDWNAKEWGFCEREDQCFVLKDIKGERKDSTAATFYDGGIPTCLNNGEFVLDHYCDSGNWTTRTKEVAMKLYEVGQTDEFVLYCSPYDQTLPDFEAYSTKIGSAPNPCFRALEGFATQAEGGILSSDENTCINSVCVLQKKSGNDFITAFATTLNREINDAENPFLESLGIPKEKLNALCQGDANNGYIECALDQTGVSGSLYYNPSIKSIIYSKEEFNLDPSLLQRIARPIITFFQGLFGAERQTTEATFVGVNNAHKLYFLNEGEKKVQAVQQLVPGKGDVLVAHYEGFETPVCTYVTNAKVPPNADTSVFDQERTVQCTVEDATNTQRVEITSNPDAFWPALTGGLRVNSEER